MKWLTDWDRPPDKVVRFEGRPVMIWTQPGDLKAVSGTVQIQVYRRGERFAAPISGGSSKDEFFGYSGQEWEAEPSADEFEAYVMRALEILRREGRLLP